MKILLVAATWMEVNLLVEELEKVEEKSHLLKTYRLGENLIDVLISGIGVTFTTFHLTSTLHQEEYDLVINFGIAGSLTHQLEIGEVVNVVYEEFADLGIETSHEFLTLFESGYMNINEFPFENGILKATSMLEWDQLKKVRGITVSKSHRNRESISKILSKFSGHTESMEGAAVFYVCNWMGVECCQIRAISNYLEPDSSAKWNIPLALDNLKHSLLRQLKQLAVSVN
ncbi:futalosine hydrolase [Maribellus sediminis]|uniref:futalosine hydrolase n=1 Tax=Maribellus sediminis TaxID=2696285 RepID=UPI0014317E5F|nr:futalosine hydrolase [Maribellus sediminis]